MHTLGPHFDSAPFLGLYSLQIPNVPTSPGPELKVLTTAAQIVLDFMGLLMRTGLNRILLFWMGLSITLIQDNHHHFCKIDSLYQPQNSALRPSFLGL